MEDIAIFGRKTFFIAPDAALLLEVYLEAFLARGYECYIVNSDSQCSLKKKVSDIIALYPGAILVFNVDSHAEGILWQTYIQDLQRQHGGSEVIAVTHAHVSDADDAAQASTYRQLGIAGGTVPLGADGARNLMALSNLLFQNGACGRRTMVRAPCDEASTLSFTHRGRQFNARILDVNMHYFACDLAGNSVDLDIYNRLQGASLVVNGMSFQADLVLIMRGMRRGVNLYVFMFTKEDGTPELAQPLQQQLSRKVYQMVTTKGKEEMRRAWSR